MNSETREPFAATFAVGAGGGGGGPETFEEKRTRLRALDAERGKARAAAKQDAEIAVLELRDRFERELGPEGQAYAMFDASSVGEGIFVVKLGEGILYTTFMESKLTPVDRYDFVAPCVVYPSRSDYDRAQARRPGLNVELSNRLAGLFGLKLKADEGK